ncbi:MAG: orotidine-5'-phosphate decarboxylase [Planctomycetota bacterium]|nr:MAG: orotidine-5'-phosphate decarboxylase [Planctomycetota bacterium]
MLPQLCVALDVSDIMEMVDVVERLRGVVRMFKVGSQLFCSCGPGAVYALRSRGLEVFVDLKLHDIPSVVEEAASRLAACGANMLTIHATAGPDAFVAAKRALSRFPDPPKIIAVTVLTTLKHETLKALKLNQTPQKLTVEWAKLAVEAGADGVVASVSDVARLRKTIPDVFVVCPGIRPAGTEAHDQVRVATPADAAKAAANVVVVGRPIVRAQNPRSAAQNILDEMRSALEETF